MLKRFWSAVTSPFRAVFRFFSGGVGEVGREAAVSGIMHATIEKLKGRAAAFVDENLEQQREKLLGFIVRELRSVGDDGRRASQVLLDRHGKRDRCEPPYKPGDENEFVRRLRKLLDVYAGDKATLIELFKFLALELDDEQFNAALSFLRNDVIAQFGRRLAYEIRRFREWLRSEQGQEFTGHFRNAGRHMSEAANDLAERLHSLRTDLRRRGVLTPKKSRLRAERAREVVNRALEGTIEPYEEGGES